MYNKSRFISLFLLAGMAITCCLAGCKKKDMSLKLNEPHNIRGVISYKRSFGDLNEKHLNVAQAIGIRPLASREEAEKWKKRCSISQQMICTRLILWHIPSRISFRERLPCSIQSVITSRFPGCQRLESEQDYSNFRTAYKRRCQASAPSQRQCIRKFRSLLRHDIRCQLETLPEVEDEDGRPLQDVSSDTLKLVLSEVLRDLKRAEKCYIKYELRQGCFHITTRM